jgi:uncharacterized protein (UPF0335 family)
MIDDPFAAHMKRGELVRRGQAMHAMIEKIMEMEREKAKLYDDLRLHADLLLQGVDGAKVQSFGFCAADLKHVRQPLRGTVEHEMLHSSPAGGWTTRVEMDDGSEVVLNPPLKVRREKSDG